MVQSKVRLMNSKSTEENSHLNPGRLCFPCGALEAKMEVNALECGEFPTPGHIRGVLRTDGKHAEVISQPEGKWTRCLQGGVLYFYEY